VSLKLARLLKILLLYSSGGNIIGPNNGIRSDAYIFAMEAKLSPLLTIYLLIWPVLAVSSISARVPDGPLSDTTASHR